MVRHPLHALSRLIIHHFFNSAPSLESGVHMHTLCLQLYICSKYRRPVDLLSASTRRCPSLPITKSLMQISGGSVGTGYSTASGTSLRMTTVLQYRRDESILAWQCTLLQALPFDCRNGTKHLSSRSTSSADGYK